jgi:hypothetical protein
MQNSKAIVRASLIVFLLAGMLAGAALPGLQRVQAAPQGQTITHVVISQVYGGGGNTGAPYQNDFVELFNPSDTTISLNGWSIQYAAATGASFSNAANLSGWLIAGQYYLVQLNLGGTNGVPLPTPDASGTTAMGSTAGKVILANITTGLSCNGGSTCSPSQLASIVDLVGYGTTADSFEGTGPAPAPSNATADLRSGNGCSDTDDNSADFAASTPSPRNSSSSIFLCMDPLTVTAVANLTATASAANLTATASAANLTGTAAAANLTATASAANLTATSVALTGTSTPTPTATATLDCISAPSSTPLTILINEVAWAGTAASTSDEWIELYNPGSICINLINWKLTADDDTPDISLTGVIPGGGYYLLERTDDTTISDIPADQIYTGEMTNDSEVLRLYNPNSGLVDTANSDGGAWPAGSTTSYRSMERRAVVLDSFTAWVTNIGLVRNGKDANGNAINGTPKKKNWAATVTITPSPRPPTRTPTRVPTPNPLVTLNEFLPRAGFDWNQDGVVNVYDEFIEIMNLGPIDVSLNGWKLDDEADLGSNPYSIPNQTLKVGQRLVLYGSVTHILLDDSGDTVRLINSRGVIVDARTYPAVKIPDRSHCRIFEGNGNWYNDCFPTPGTKNARSGIIPESPAGSLLEPACPLPDGAPEAFRQAECHAFGADIWSRLFWDKLGLPGELPVQDEGSKWGTYLE